MRCYPGERVGATYSGRPVHDMCGPLGTSLGRLALTSVSKPISGRGWRFHYWSAEVDGVQLFGKNRGPGSQLYLRKRECPKKP